MSRSLCVSLIDCLLHDVQWQLLHAYSGREKVQELKTNYADIRDEFDNMDKDFWIPLEKYEEFGKDEKFNKRL